MMRSLLLLCFFNLAYSADQNVIPILYNSFYAYFGKSASSYLEAKQACKERNSQLLIISNKRQLKMLKEFFINLKNVLADYSGVWLNLHRSPLYKDAFVWSDGTYLRRNLVTWAPNEPSNENNAENCLVYLKSGYWTTTVCQDASNFSFICQNRTKPTTTLAIIDPTTEITIIPATAASKTNPTTLFNATIRTHDVKAEPCNIVVGLAMLNILCIGIIICLAVVVHKSRSKSKGCSCESRGGLAEIDRAVAEGAPCSYSYPRSRTENQPAQALGYTSMQPLPQCTRAVLVNDVTDEYVDPVPRKASSKDDYTDVALSTVSQITTPEKISSDVNQNLQEPISYINVRSDSV